MTLPDGHGRCVRHRNYDLDCDDFERLRARAGDRCEMPGCGVAGGETKPGLLFIDHQGSIWGPGARVRGLLCQTCNTRLGRAEIGAGRYYGREPRSAELEYLARPFFLEPESIVIQDCKDAYRENRRIIVAELAKRATGEPCALSHMSHDEAITYALMNGVRQATIYRNARYAESRVLKMGKAWRAAAA